ncbi:hypothetical protein GALL_514630 [mine drainage metagenome]|uniref:Uncharacterized protein n=1 Tax=mine drainage metagenome TaxID=410659 RepID=A0A1J5P6Y1_9ZZZZ
MVFIFEPGFEGADGRQWGIHGHADVGHGTIGGITGQLNDLLVGQRGLANHRLVPALFAQLAQQAGRFFFMDIGKNAISVALLGLEHGRREIDLATVGGDFADNLGAGLGQGFLDHVQPAFAEVIVHVNQGHRLEL